VSDIYGKCQPRPCSAFTQRLKGLSHKYIDKTTPEEYKSGSLQDRQKLKTKPGIKQHYTLPSPHPTLTLTKPPSVSVWLGELGDTGSSDDDLSGSGRHICPDDLFDVVGIVESCGCSRVTVALIPVAANDDEIEIVLQTNTRVST